MDDIVKLIVSNGWGVFLTGLVASLLVGLIKTPLRSVFVGSKLDEQAKKKREAIFDSFVFILTFITAFAGAFVYVLIKEKTIGWGHSLKVWLPVWMAQSMVYGVWKKLGLKSFLLVLARLFVRDTNKDGKISMDEVISQLRVAYKDGKINISDLVEDITKNAGDNLEGVVTELTKDQEITPEIETVAKAIESEALVNKTKEPKEKIVTKDLGDGVEVTNNKTITF